MNIYFGKPQGKVIYEKSFKDSYNDSYTLYVIVLKSEIVSIFKIRNN